MSVFRCAVVLFALVSARDKVRVQYIFEAGCPFCLEATTGAVNRTLEASGVAALIDFEMLPIGNGYYEFEKCDTTDLWDRDHFHCVSQHCSADSDQGVAEGCFSGELISQHGQLESELDTYLACAVQQGIDALALNRFNACLSQGFSQGAPSSQGLVQECAAAISSLSLPILETCYEGPDFPNAMQQLAAVTPLHLVVPTLLVNGRAVADTNNNENLLLDVCNAISGEKPAGCANPIEWVSVSFLPARATHKC